jgi:hypothetical protein
MRIGPCRLFLCALLSCRQAPGQNRITTPKEQFGFNLGTITAGQLRSWSNTGLDRESDRMIWLKSGRRPSSICDGNHHVLKIKAARPLQETYRLARAEGLSQTRRVGWPLKAKLWSGSTVAQRPSGRPAIDEMVYRWWP